MILSRGNCLFRLNPLFIKSASINLVAPNKASLANIANNVNQTNTTNPFSKFFNRFVVYYEECLGLSEVQKARNEVNKVRFYYFILIH
jgi:hypothetical protein